MSPSDQTGPSPSTPFRHPDAHLSTHTASDRTRLLDVVPGSQPVPEFPPESGLEIVEELGHGGMGVVYKAWQRRLDRFVAIKMIRSGSTDAKTLARFRTEAEAVARLHHPNIVQVHEVGTLSGQPYMVLEYVEGSSLDKDLRGEPMPPKRAAERMLVLAQALQAAHERGILHRDLKPANILLDAQGAPKIADFGLAKRMDADSGQSRSGDLIGTPSYMAPEQAAGRVGELGPATDVYALGAILYELLTGRPPFRGPTVIATLDQVVNLDPVRPSQLQPAIPTDLETICLHCLRKHSFRRYESAAALAADLRRHLQGEPIRARPIGAPERIFKWMKRRPAAAALVAVTFLAGVSMLAGAWHFTERLRDERDAAIASEQEAARQRDRAEAEQQNALAEWRRAEAEQQEAIRQLNRSRSAIYALQLVRVAAMADIEASRPQALGILEDTNACPLDLREFAWGYLYGKCTGHKETVLNGKRARCLAFFPDGKSLLWGTEDGALVRSNLADGEEIFRVPAHRERVRALAVRPDGERLATGGVDDDVILWDAAGRKVANLKGQKGAVEALAFAPDGTVLASAGSDTAVRLWDVADHRESTVLKGHQGNVIALAWSRDSRLLASASYDKSIRVWDRQSAKCTTTISGGQMFAMAFPGDGKSVAAIDSAGLAGGERRFLVHRWSIPAGTFLGDLRGPTFGGWKNAVLLAQSPVDRTIASAAQDGMLHIWDLTAGQNLLSLPGHPLGTYGMAFSADGTKLATCGPDALKVWTAFAPDHLGALKGHHAVVFALAPSDADRTLVSGGLDESVILWDAVTGQQRSRFAMPGFVYALAPLGNRALAAAVNGNDNLHAVFILDPKDGKEILKLQGHVNHLYDLDVSPDGSTLASASADKTVALWQVSNGKRTHQLRGHTDAVVAVRFLADGKSAISASLDGTVRIWDVETGQSTRTLDATIGSLRALAIPAHNRIVAVAGDEGKIALLDLSLGRVLDTWEGHPRGILTLAFSPDGKRLASAGNDAKLNIWDLESRKRIATISHAVAIRKILFDSAGTRLFAGDERGEIRIWDAKKWRPAAP